MTAVFDLVGAGTGAAVGAASAPTLRAVLIRPPLRVPAPRTSSAGDQHHTWSLAVLIVTCALTGARIGLAWSLPAFLAFTVGSVTAGLVDARWQVLPKRVVYPTWVTVTAGLALDAGLTHHPHALVDAVAAGTVVFAVFAVLHLAKPNSIAFGDVRFLGLIATGLGWWGSTTAGLGIAAGLVAAGVISAIRLGAGRLNRNSSIPLGPYLAAGAIITVWLAAPR